MSCLCKVDVLVYKHRQIHHHKQGESNYDQYLVLANDNTYILTDEVIVDIDDYAANETTFNQYDISDDMREEMDAVITAQKTLGNDDLEIVVYAPSNVSSGIQPRGNAPIGTTYYEHYANGITYKMKNYTVAYRNLSTGMIEKKGTGTLSQAKAWTNFVVSAVGAVSKTVGAFGIFSSAYEAYKASKGAVVTGSSSDHMYTNLVYDRLMKETYAADIYGDYILGCVSYKVWLNRHDNYQYYGSTGRAYYGSDTLNTEHYSENFNYPSPTAIQNAGGGYYIDGFQYTKVFGKTVRLMGT